MIESDKIEIGEIRQEIRQQTDISTKVFASSIAIAVTLIGYIVETDEVSFLFFFVPFFIVLGGLIIIVSRFQSIYRLASYQKVFLEKIDGVFYENRLSKFRDIGANKGTKYGRVIVLFYASIVLVLCLVFFLKGFKSIEYICFFTIITVVYYFISNYYMSFGELNKYESIWQTIKEEEKYIHDKLETHSDIQ